MIQLLEVALFGLFMVIVLIVCVVIVDTVLYFMDR